MNKTYLKMREQSAVMAANDPKKQGNIIVKLEGRCKYHILDIAEYNHILTTEYAERYSGRILCYQRYDEKTGKFIRVENYDKGLNFDELPIPVLELKPFEMKPLDCGHTALFAVAESLGIDTAAYGWSHADTDTEDTDNTPSGDAGVYLHDDTLISVIGNKAVVIPTSIALTFPYLSSNDINYLTSGEAYLDCEVLDVDLDEDMRLATLHAYNPSSPASLRITVDCTDLAAIEEVRETILTCVPLMEGE